MGNLQPTWVEAGRPAGDIFVLSGGRPVHTHPPLFFVHATGFNATTYRPFLSELATERQIFAPSVRGHGATKLDPAISYPGWHVHARDMSDLVPKLIAEGPIHFAGHSMGAIVSLLTAASMPSGRVASLTMIDPVILPRMLRASAALSYRANMRPDSPMSVKARKRRNRWEDRQEAIEGWRSGKFFGQWDDGALEGYAEEGLRDVPGGGVELSCAPEFEANTFGAQGHRVFGPLRKLLKSGVRVTVLKASTRSTVAPWVEQRLRALGVVVEEIEGGHLLPQERKEQTLDAVRRALAGVEALAASL